MLITVTLFRRHITGTFFLSDCDEWNWQQAAKFPFSKLPDRHHQRKKCRELEIAANNFFQTTEAVFRLGATKSNPLSTQMSPSLLINAIIKINVFIL